MEFRILGPLEVAAGDGVADVSGRRDRVLLSALVLGATEVSSQSRLIEALWGETPPQSAPKTLQNVVLRLRKLLGQDVIETLPSGYRLAVPAGSVDAVRFDELIGAARAARVNGDPVRAAALFTDALALWRGDPLEDLVGWAPGEAEAIRLSELQCSAVEERVDAELAAGRHRQCIGTLETMVTEHPLRERRWSMLMLALYRSGRQAEALRAFQRARAMLIQELGIEPGPELRALERAVFEQDVSLEIEVEPNFGAPVPGRVPDTGIVFILFSDLSSSTEMLERLGDDAAEDVRRVHFALLRRAVDDHAGVEVKSLGDGLMVVFASAVDALNCALDMQRSVAKHNLEMIEPLHVRIGLHVGEPIREEDDYFGTAVVVARRLCDSSVDGGILASALVADLVGSRGGFTFDDVGAIPVKGLRDPVPAVELVDEQTANLEQQRRIGEESPYKGLAAFEPDDREVYFGRDEVVGVLLQRLATARLLAVVGASGSGKSSVVRAGVLSALRNEGLPGSTRWPTLLMTPGPHPLAELAGQLARHAGVDSKPLLDDLEVDPSRLDLAARQLLVASPPGARVLIVIDQFEELFTLCRDAVERQRFISALTAALAEPVGVTTVVIALRADFFGHCGSSPDLARFLEAGTALLGPMSPVEIQAAIEGPARLAGLRLEPGLAELIVRDVVDEPGALPLLSHALLETWKRRRRRTLTVAGYRDAGGAQGAIAKTAETVYDGFAPGEQRLTRDIFVRLTELGDGTEDTRRRVARSELQIAPDDGGTDGVLNVLAGARLVTLDEDTAEVAHEALIREWPRLRTWLDEDRDGLRVHRHLTHATSDWDALDRSSSELYRGPRLAAANEWARRERETGAEPGGDAGLNPTEQAFLDASNGQERAETWEQAAQVRRLRWLLAGVAVALVVALVTGGVAIAQRARADRAAATSHAASVSAQVARAVTEVPVEMGRDRALGSLLAVQAERLQPDAASRGALLDATTTEPRLQFTVTGGRPGYAWLAPYPDHRRVAVAGRAGVDVWDLASRRKIGSFAVGGSADGVAVSGDGRVLAVGNQRGLVHFYDGRSLEPMSTPLHVDAPVTDLAFLPGGHEIAVAVGTVQDAIASAPFAPSRVWDIASHQPTGVSFGGHAASVNSLAVSPDGTIIATGDNAGRVVFNRAVDGTAVGRSMDFGSPIYDLAYSADGSKLGIGFVAGNAALADATSHTKVLDVAGANNRLATVGFDATGRQFVASTTGVGLWDTTTLQQIEPPIDTQHGPALISGRPDGRLALTGSDGTIGVWEPAAAPAMATPVVGSPANGGMFSPDGRLLAISDVRGSVALFRSADHAPLDSLALRSPGQPQDPPGSVTPIAFSPNGRLIAMGDGAGRVGIFDATTRCAVHAPVQADASPIDALAFSPDGGTLVATSSEDTTAGAHAIDIQTGSVTMLPVPHALAASYRPDGKRLAITSGAGGGAVFDVSRGVTSARSVHPFGTAIETAAYSPDGALLAVGSQGGAIQLLDARSLQPRGRSVSVSPRMLAVLTFSPDSRVIVSEDIGVKYRLFDVASRAPIGDPIPNGSSGYGITGFSPDSRTLVLPGAVNSALWRLDVTSWRRTACARAGRNLTRAEWTTYFSAAGAYQATCTGAPTGS